MDNSMSLNGINRIEINGHIDVTISNGMSRIVFPIGKTAFRWNDTIFVDSNIGEVKIYLNSQSKQNITIGSNQDIIVQKVNYLGELELNTTFGDIVANGINISKIKASNIHGDINIKSGTIKSLDTSTVHGDICISNSSILHKIFLKTEHGDIKLHNNDLSECSIINTRSTMGDVLVDDIPIKPNQIRKIIKNDENVALDFTFLTEYEIFGNNQLDIISRYGTKCAITDFSILLGGYVSPDCYTREGNTRKDRTGWWWTKSSDGNNGARVVFRTGDSYWANVRIRYGGARPALPYSSIQSISSNGVRGANGIKEIEYGEYPQTIVDENYSRELERAYNNRSLRTTGKNYTTDSIRYQATYTSFRARTHTEYEYNGSKYIRFVGDSNCDGKVLSDGRAIKTGQAYWVRVEPITWLVDERANIALSKKLIFSGVQFKNRRDYKGDFDRTDIKQFMDNYFSKEIVSDRVYSPAAPVEQTQNLDKKEEKLIDITIGRVLGRNDALKKVREDYNNFKTLDLKFRSDREIVLEAVTMDGLLLEYASEDLKSDIEIINKALNSNPMALKFASNQIKDDDKIVMDVVSRCGAAVQFASPRLKQDRRIALAAVKNDGEALQYLPNFKSDREIVLEAVMQNGLALRHADKVFFSDKEIVINVLSQKQSTYLIIFISEDLKDDRDVILAAYKVNKAYLQYASERLKDEFRIEMIKSYTDALLGEVKENSKKR